MVKKTAKKFKNCCPQNGVAKGKKDYLRKNPFAVGFIPPHRPSLVHPAKRRKKNRKSICRGRKTQEEDGGWWPAFLFILFLAITALQYSPPFRLEETVAQCWTTVCPRQRKSDFPPPSPPPKSHTPLLLWHNERGCLSKKGIFGSKLLVFFLGGGFGIHCFGI